jgi:fructoselysine 6-kinase
MIYVAGRMHVMMKLVGVGDNTVDRYLHLGQMFPGGNAVNVAALAHRYGAESSYIGWLGSDPHGELVLQSLRDEGVDTSRCRVVEGPNAYCEVDLVGGDRVFGRSRPGVRSLIKLDEEDLAFIEGHDVAHASVYSFLEPQLWALSEAARILSFDYSQGWGEDYLKVTLPLVDVAFMSAPGMTLYEVERLMRRVHGLGPELVVITRGGMGASAYDGAQLIHQPVAEARVVDTLGAGDAFAARILCGRVEGTALEESMARAEESSAETCGYYGAWGHSAPLWDLKGKEE